MDYCQWLKNAPFLRYVGPAAPWGECLSCYGSHLGVHHPIVSHGSTKNGPDPGDDWRVYAGIPHVHILWAQIGETVGDPLAAIGCLIDGRPVIGRCLLSATDRFTLDFYPHKLVTNISCDGIDFHTQVIFADHSTLLLKCRIAVTRDDVQRIAAEIQAQG